MNLYEMTDSAKMLYALLDSEEIDEQAVKDTIEAMGVTEKLESYCQIIRELESDAAKYKAEKDRLAARQKSAENNVARMKAAILEYMNAAHTTKEKAGTFTVSIAQSVAVNITDESKIPAFYLMEQPPKINKAEIGKALKSGEAVNGAELQTNSNVRIK